jgi:hypothetical protein
MSTHQVAAGTRPRSGLGRAFGAGNFSVHVARPVACKLLLHPAMRRLAMLIWVSACAGGVDHDGHEPGPTPAPSGDEAGWECAMENGAMQCTSTVDDTAHDAYTCSAGEEGCPPGGADWACIAGHGVVSCRDVVSTETMTAMRPTDCNVADWKAFFCQIAQLKIEEHGFEYTLDCNDLQDQLQLQPLPSPNCDEVVNPLELESWTEAAYASCSGALSQEITAWCYNTNLVLSNAGVCDAQ